MAPTRRKKKDQPQGNPHSTTFDVSDISVVLQNVISMITHMAEHQEQLETLFITEIKKLRESHDNSYLSLCRGATFSLGDEGQNPSDHTRVPFSEIIKLPVASMTDLHITDIHEFMESHVKDIETDHGGYKKLTKRLEKRIRWECEEVIGAIRSDNGKIPPWKRLSKRGQIIRSITAEAEALGIPARRCEDLWPIVFLVKQHWGNKVRYQRRKIKAKKLLQAQKRQAVVKEGALVTEKNTKEAKKLARKEASKQLMINEKRLRNKQTLNPKTPCQ
ncbi:hypothetical protein BJV82DRAFT_658051 [Fennellomyces sp. T-0311]|nr:hypothetical protein BJV82DRAFT_661867 [Fennellomyces sp. T-0311]KAI8142011.1 hypothetical protein BJV82DRAFT_658051 [Fennellomyces sp. T-0311]